MIGKLIGEITYNFWGKPGDIKSLINQFADQYIHKEKNSIWKHIQKAFNVGKKPVKFDFTFKGPLDEKLKEDLQKGHYFTTPDGFKADGKRKIVISHIFIKPVSFIIFSRVYYLFVLMPKGCFSKKKKVIAYLHKTIEEEVRYRSIASIQRNEKMKNYSKVDSGCFGEKRKRYQKPEAFIRIRGADIYTIPGDKIKEMDAAVKQMNTALEQHERKGSFNPSINTNINVSPSFQVGQIGHDKSKHDHSKSTNIQDSVVQRSNIDQDSSKADKISICPYCGKDLNFPKPPKFCPYCKEQIQN